VFLKKAVLWQVDPVRPDQDVIRKAVGILRSGGLVAFPTETVYGLGANAFNAEAIKKIFLAKGRPQDNPLIVHVANRQMVGELTFSINRRAERLMDIFWPGPLTIILPRGKKVPAEVSAGLASVAIRMPAHQVALDLISCAQLPVAAPSANVSGRPSPTTAMHVYEDLGGQIEAILDGGPADLGVESTVLDLTSPVPVILRPGGVTLDELEKEIGEVRIDPLIEGALFNGSEGEQVHFQPRSPGMKYRHYAPRAPLFLVEGESRRVTAKVRELAALRRAEGLRVGVLAYEETADFYAQNKVLTVGSIRSTEQIASRLYSILRRFDEIGVDVIIAEGIEPHGLGLAIMNRLRRASGGKVVRA